MSFLVALVLSIVIVFALLKTYDFVTHRNCKSKVCLVGKTALVTGGSAGIGYQIVLNLLQRGCRVIIASRTCSKNLLENMYRETKSRNVIFKHLDLCSFKSVQELAGDLIENEAKLDILIHNAGIGSTAPSNTEDGLDRAMQVNYFSQVLLTQLLEDLLKKSKSRIIFTGSSICYFSKFSLERLKLNGTQNVCLYPDSKLCLVMATITFAERLKDYGVTSNIYHPGLVNTEIFNKSIISTGSIDLIWFGTKFLEYLAILVGKTAERGAQTAIHLACATEVEGITGDYFSETSVTFKPSLARDKKMRSAVWDITQEIIKSKLCNNKI